MIKNRKIFVAFILFSIIILHISNLFASTLKLDITTDKEKIKKGDEFTITVKWDKEMQAADFTLNYDSKKLEFIESNIDDMFIDNSEKGKLKTAWVSVDDTNKTSIEYKFKAKKTGKMKFSTEVTGGFADGNLEMPSDYSNATLTIGKTNILPFIIIFIIIILLLIFLKNKKIKK